MPKNKNQSTRDYAERDLGSFEVRLLAAINHLRDEAWGSNLQRNLSQVLGRDVAIGQLYLALSRLEERGLIASEIVDPKPVRGGRSKKVFRLETPGVRALESLAAALSTLGALPSKEQDHGEVAA